VVVKKLNNSIKVFGTPLGGELKPANKNARLEKIFFIIKDEKSYFKKLKQLNVLTEALSNNFLFMSIRARKEPRLIKNLFKLNNDIFKDVAGYELHFNLEDDFWRCIHGLERNCE
jgi:hypothetical protein